MRVDPNFNPFEAVPGSGGGAMAATAPPEAPPSPDEGEFSAAQAAGRDGLPPALRDSLLPGGTFNGVGGRKPLASALAEAALAENPAHRISDPVLDRSVSAAAEYRANGDMVEALKALRQAESVLPNHPRVLSELATTFSAMGQDQRAAVYWRKVRDLGGQGGGGYYDIAGSELSGDRLGAAAARAVLRLGKIAAIPDTAATEGERVVLRVEVLADPVTRPRSDEMAMLVYFYDEVDGAKTQATTADTAQNFVSDPYDWTSGLEVIEVEYYQPPFTPEQKRELGARRYKGYIVELYYRDELQDVAADPAELRALDPTVPMPEPEPVETIGPDSSLFPSPPVPENP
ncbi:MAG: hypothetical protein H7A53_01905 [Akkermansiaceae bacterium]|nr:hypothetical protein [Akkermansiaceae bacterium]